ncbi:MAG: ABC transporter permease [Candidatus Aminicenantales bacterium]
MTIKEKGYSHWDGQLQHKRFPWWPITRLGIKSTFKKKFFKLAFLISLLPALGFLAGIYIAERIEDFRFMIDESEAVKFLNITPGFFSTYFTNNFLLFWIVIILIFCGAGLIADDIKYNSLQLYFARPLTKNQYFLGKASVIFFFLSLLTLVPGLILIIFKLVFSGSFLLLVSYPWLPLSVIGFSVFLTGFFVLYALMLSSLSQNRRYVAVLIFGIYFFSNVFYRIFYAIFHDPHFALLSVEANIKQIGALFFNQKLPYDIHWSYSLLVFVGFSAAAFFLLKNKIKEVEVVK